jgi:hypothetical protein
MWATEQFGCLLEFSALDETPNPTAGNRALVVARELEPMSFEPELRTERREILRGTCTIPSESEILPDNDLTHVDQIDKDPLNELPRGHLGKVTVEGLHDDHEIRSDPVK